MSKIIATVGLPGSGKSTWAEEEAARLEQQGVKVFISNKDTIRKALTASGWTWSREAEKDVIRKQNDQIKNVLAAGVQVVIVADTNFGTHVDRLKGLAMHCGVDFEIKDFTDVPLATCIERDSKRSSSVGEKVIVDMYNTYVLTRSNPYVPDHGKNPAIICDLDGTLALHEGIRNPYNCKEAGLDNVNDPIARIVGMCKTVGYTILYVSGRKEECRNISEMWLRKHGLPLGTPHVLLMRKDDDNRKDYIVKREIFDTHIRKNYNVRFVLDDRDQVVKMWRDLGLTCLQVNYGAF